MLLFFTLSGLWQLYPKSAARPSGAPLLSTIHTGRPLKTETLSTLSSPALRGFVVLMALSLILNVALGLALALRSIHRRTAAWSLFAGAAIPAAMVVFVVWRTAQALPGN